MSAPCEAASTMLAFILASVAAVSPQIGVKLTQATVTTASVPRWLSALSSMAPPLGSRGSDGSGIAYVGSDVSDLDPLAETAERLAQDHGLGGVVEQRTIRLPEPVKGDPGITVLRVLGAAQDDTPVGAAAHGGQVVAIGVWQQPDLYLARWTNGKRWGGGDRLTPPPPPHPH